LSGFAAERRIRWAAKVTIQDVGSIGELVAAIATVATLAYLAVQIRQNTRSLHANAHQEVVSSSNDWSELFVHHPETGELFRKGISDPSSLDSRDTIEFVHLLEIYIRNYSTARFLVRDGLIPQRVCEAYEHSLGKWFSSPELRTWWRDRAPVLSSIVESVLAAQESIETDVK
jgi:hypothetical protein